MLRQRVHGGGRGHRGEELEGRRPSASFAFLCLFVYSVVFVSACLSICLPDCLPVTCTTLVGIVEGEKDNAEGLSAALLWVLDFVEAEQFAGDTRPRYWAIRCLLDALVRLIKLL